MSSDGNVPVLQEENWVCQVCTFTNPGNLNGCSMCSTNRGTFIQPPKPNEEDKKK